MSADNSKIVSLALDLYHGKPIGTYSKEESMETLRKALVDANGGSTKLNFKAIRDGKCKGLFAIVEEIIARTVREGIQEDSFFANNVEYKNIALGDENDFYIPNNSLLVVSDIAQGTQGLRRQRLNAGEHIKVPTQLKGIKIYEELNRVLSGRVDFNEFIRLVGESFQKQMRMDIYTAFQNLAESGSPYFPARGSYSEDNLIALIDHVEAATGKVAKLVGTRAALRQITPTVSGEAAKTDLYNIGYYGKFNGTDCIKINQVHAPGTTNFLLDDKKIYVIATDDKPIKVVTEGEGLIHMSDPFDNADLSQEYLYAESYGIAIASAEQFGIYTMT